MLADYWYCSCAADLPPPGFSVPAPWPPEPEEPSGAWEEAEGSPTQGPDACGSGAEDAEADTDAGGADAGADAEAGTSWTAPFPEPSSRAPTKPLGATRVPPSRPPSKLLTAPTVFNPSGSCERSQPRQAGYSTYFGGKYTNGYDGNAIPPGWDAWFAMVEPINEADSFLYRNSSRTRRYHRVVDNETDVLSVNAERFVRDQAGSSVPWFAYVCPHAPHSSYYPAPRHADEFTSTPLRNVPNGGEQDLSDKPRWLQAEAPYTDSERQRYTGAYRGKLRELQEVDDMVRRLMDALAETNQLKNTFVFFLTDNGYLLGEHGLYKKNIPYEEASRTPFIVRGPGVRSGFKSSVMVSHTDLPPTLLDLAGALWADLDGRSLVPVFSAGGGQPAGWRDEILVEDLGRGWNMLRTPKWAYVEWDDAEKELYDMDADPYQLQSLHADPGKADLIARLSSQLSDMKGA